MIEDAKICNERMLNKMGGRSANYGEQTVKNVGGGRYMFPQTKEIIKLAQKGMTKRQISKKLNIPLKNITRTANRHKLHIRRE